MDMADEYKRRAEQAERWAQRPALTAAEREAFQRIVKGWRALESAARGRAKRRASS